MERVIEIVNFVMKQILFQGENNCSERDLMNALAQLGYTSNEIRDAFKLLHSIPSSLHETMPQFENVTDLKGGHRILSPEEHQKLTVSCQGEIFRLISSSLLTTTELERVLFEAVQMENNEVGLRELELILHKVIADEERLLLILPHPTDLGPSLLLN